MVKSIVEVRTFIEVIVAAVVSVLSLAVLPTNHWGQFYLKSRIGEHLNLSRIWQFFPLGIYRMITSIFLIELLLYSCIIYCPLITNELFRMPRILSFIQLRNLTFFSTLSKTLGCFFLTLDFFCDASLLWAF